MDINPTQEERVLRILVVADDKSVLRDFAGVLECLGHNEFHLAHTLTEARRILEEMMIDIVFAAPRLSPGIQNREGFTILQDLSDHDQTLIIVVGRPSQPDDVRQALALGAEDYVFETEIEQRVPIILQKLRRKLGAQHVLELLYGNVWLGNIRALHNDIERLTTLASFERIELETTRQHLASDAGMTSDDELPGLMREMARRLIELPLQDKIDAITEALVLEALEQAGGNNTQAGRLLGRHRKFVERFLKKRASAGGSKPKQSPGCPTLLPSAMWHLE